MIGYIYKLTSVHTDKCYVGSTKQSIEARFGKHKSTYKLWKKGSSYYTSSFVLFELGIDAVQIEMLEEIVFENIIELKDKERFYINTNNCVNLYLPNRTITEWRADNIEHNKNRDAEYYIVNKEYRLDFQKKYRLENLETIKKKHAEQFNCDCGGHYNYCHKLRHLQSQKHLNYQSAIAVSLS